MMKKVTLYDLGVFEGAAAFVCQGGLLFDTAET